MAEPQTDVEPGTTGNSSTSGSNAPQYHPSFSSPDADVVFLSDDAVHFRVHKLVLQLGSGFFKTMLEMPRDAAEASTNEPIPIQEKSNVFAILLDIIYPHRQLPELHSLEFVKEIFQAAEKYEMPKVSDSLRHLVKSQYTFLGRPIDLYVLASQNGWEDVAKTASTKTLQFNLYSPEFSDPLKSLDGDHLLRLFRLHRTRRRSLIDALDPTLGSVPTVLWQNVISISPPCTHWLNHYFADNSTCMPWMNLKRIVSEALEVQPSGDAIRQRSFIDDPALQTLWEYQCAQGACSQKFFSKDRLHAELIRVLDLLPTTV